jgi:hypothetical protein
MERRLTDPEHIEAQRLAIFDEKIVIRKLQVLDIPIDHMNLRAWYVYLPCGARFYVGRYDQKKFQQVIDHDERSHQRMRDRARGRLI